MTVFGATGAEVAELMVEPVRSDLSVSEIARRLCDEPALVVLAGCWSGPGAVIASSPIELVVGQDDPFELLDRQLPLEARSPQEAGTTGAVGGGWIGYLGYDVGRLVEALPAPPPSVTPLPSFVLGYYDHLLRYDALGRRWWFEALVTPSRRDAIAQRREHLVAQMSLDAPSARPYAVGGFAATPSRDDHEEAVARTVDHVAAGDIFQSNITMRLDADFEGSPLELYLAGLENLAPPYGAFLSGDWGSVASLSPELFVSVRGRTVTTSPIKGTAPRGGDARSDRVARELLSTSAKDRAENVMIVDLMRNDLGRVAVPGTVRVDELCAVRPMSGVWHMVSTVTGELRPAVSDGDLLRATFPPGSVTGAPKIRAMEVIAELEPTAREVYTGSVVLASPALGLTSSVAIRTFEIAHHKVWVGVGGGVVADSTPSAEYGECLAKARPLLSAIGAELIQDAGTAALATPDRPSIDVSRGVFETILTLDGQVVDPVPHLERLGRSTQVLYGQPLLPPLSTLVEAAHRVPTGPGRLRVTVCPDQRPVVTISCEPFERHPSPAGLALVACSAPGGLGAHKWRDRSWIDERSVAIGDAVLLLVDGDDVLEAARSNLFVVFGSAAQTPPADGRILPGLARSAVIDLLRADGTTVDEAPVTLQSMALASEVFVTNSLRGVEWVGECHGLGTWPAGPVTARAAELLDARRAAPFESGLVRPGLVSG